MFGNGVVASEDGGMEQGWVEQGGMDGQKTRMDEILAHHFPMFPAQLHDTSDISPSQSPIIRVASIEFAFYGLLAAMPTVMSRPGLMTAIPAAAATSRSPWSQQKLVAGITAWMSGGKLAH